jgi:hypothetical protein
VDYAVWNILPWHRTVDSGGVVGFIAALKREAFFLFFRKLNISESGTRDGISLVGSVEKGGYAPDEEVTNGSCETGETIKSVWKTAESDTTVTIAESTAPSD